MNIYFYIVGENIAYLLSLSKLIFFGDGVLKHLNCFHVTSVNNWHLDRYLITLISQFSMKIFSFATSLLISITRFNKFIMLVLDVSLTIVHLGAKLFTINNFMDCDRDINPVVSVRVSFERVEPFEFLIIKFNNHTMNFRFFLLDNGGGASLIPMP